ncbi:transcriptional regulator [Antarcticirhabdus aurantiaca]|uniref:transcriptional regulator n=1 Tax=Antarcticirhabdus aurantiaca TaxID=2606717 RepID=UPI00131CC423|nr:YdaS family helix-turn-helix protein [Antarcticirhabdus aurantiaca]
MSDRDAMSAALGAAIQAVGGHAVVADKLGISTQAVWQWSICPPVRVLPLEALSGVSRHRLRPDMFGECDEGCSLVPAAEAGLVAEATQ